MTSFSVNRNVNFFPYLSINSSLSFVHQQPLPLPQMDGNIENGRQLDGTTNYVHLDDDDRSVFQTWQLDELEKCFDKIHYPNRELREEIAKRLGTTEQKLMIWFQNRRAKHRKKNNTRKRPGRPSILNPPTTCDGSPIKRLETNRMERNNIHQEELHSYSGDDEMPPNTYRAPVIGDTDPSIHNDHPSNPEEGGSIPTTGPNRTSFSTPHPIWSRLNSPSLEIGSPQFHSTPVPRHTASIVHPGTSDNSSTYQTSDSGIESMTTKSSIGTNPGSEDSSLEKKKQSRKRLSFSINNILGIED